MRPDSHAKFMPSDPFHSRLHAKGTIVRHDVPCSQLHPCQWPFTIHYCKHRTWTPFRSMVAKDVLVLAWRWD